MKKLYVLCGVPGSGKSTLAKTISKIEENTIVVSSDEIRKEFFGSESIQANGDLVFAEVYLRIKRGIENNQNIVVDAMNINRKSRKSILRLFNDDYFKVAIIVDVPLETALKQNQMRNRHVPDDVIAAKFNSFNKPTIAEGFNEIMTSFEYYDNIVSIEHEITV